MPDQLNQLVSAIHKFVPTPTPEVCPLDPVSLLHRLSLSPDPHQIAILTSPHPRLILNCCRQFGKSTITAVKAIHHSLTHPQATVLIAAPTERQSAELLDKCASYLRTLEIPFSNDRRHRAGLKLTSNQSRILALPNSDSSTRGYSASFLIIDEAARVPDSVYTALRPTLAAAADPNAPLWLLSTPAAPSGFFHKFSSHPTHHHFHYFHHPVHQCSRITPATIEQLRRELPPDQFARECLAEFSSAQSTLFSPAEIQRALTPAVTPFDFHAPFVPPLLTAPIDNLPRLNYFLGVDFGKSHDHSALALLEFRVSPTGHRDAVTYSPLALASLQLRHLDQFPLNTDYSAIIAHLRDLLAHPALAHRTALIFDANGVGAGLYELLRDSHLPAQLVPVTYTAGLRISQSRSVYHVPKSTLMTNLQTSFHQRYLSIASSLPHLDALTTELSLFERSFTAAGHPLFQPASSSQHDDLLNALALANWFVHYQYKSRLRSSAAGQLFLSFSTGGPLW